MDNLTGLTLHELQEPLHAGDVSVRELVKAYLERISTVDRKVNSYITVTGDAALNMAEQAEREIGKGRATALSGIPLGIKDLICTRGVRTTCASRMLENFVPSTARGRSCLAN